MQFIVFIIYLVYVLLFSLTTFILFGKDKRIAIKNSTNRIKEKTLLGFVCFGGALGGFFGRIIFHHKTNKIYFSLAIYLSLILQAFLFLLFFLRIL